MGRRDDGEKGSRTLLYAMKRANIFGKAKRRNETERVVLVPGAKGERRGREEKVG